MKTIELFLTICYKSKSILSAFIIVIPFLAITQDATIEWSEIKDFQKKEANYVDFLQEDSSDIYIFRER